MNLTKDKNKKNDQLLPQKTLLRSILKRNQLAIYISNSYSNYCSFFSLDWNNSLVFLMLKLSVIFPCRRSLWSFSIAIYRFLFLQMKVNVEEEKIRGTSKTVTCSSILSFVLSHCSLFVQFSFDTSNASICN